MGKKMIGSTRDQRDQIVGSTEGWLYKNVYAEAGAGTGKTRALVDRIVNLLIGDEISPENIVAVTFTVAAASELRQRVREALEQRQLELIEQGNDDLKIRITDSIESLDSAYIGTIHSFAQSLLIERPLEAGLPPVFEVSDPIAGEQQFEQAWSEWIDGTALEDLKFRSAVMDLQSLGLLNPLEKLHDLAVEFRDAYDLVEKVIPIKGNSGSGHMLETLKAILSDLEQSLHYEIYCDNPKHEMLSYLDETVRPTIRAIKESMESDSRREQLVAINLVTLLSPGNKGNIADWGSKPQPNGGSALTQIKTLLNSAKTTGLAARKFFAEQALVLAANKVADMTVAYVKSQCKAGILSFHDLLVLSCRMLEEKHAVREDFQRRYTRILIDEFQDTDPLQLKLAVLLSSLPGQLIPDPGRLFVVGDPKQSIYSFRRADLTQLSQLIESLKAERKPLDRNYRSHTEILNWVNNIFGPLFEKTNQDPSFPVQADYKPLEPGLSTYAGAMQPRVLITGGDHDNADIAREAEAKDLAKLAASVGSGAWNVTERARKSTYRDLTVLFPKRSILPFIESEFVSSGIPYVLEGQTTIFQSQAIRDLTNFLAAIDDPTDQVAVVASLKSVIWGFSDQDLYDWVKTGRKFDYASGVLEVNEQDSAGSLRIHAALTEFHAYHSNRHLDSTAGLIESIVRDRKLREVSLLINNNATVTRLVDLFIEMARSMQNVGTGSIREFIRWVERQADSDAKVAEGALANIEINAVRIMTIHASKGLEFPIVFVAGLQSKPNTPGDVLLKEYSGIPELSLQLGNKNLGMRTSKYTRMAQKESRSATAEYHRLAYVATTRARDHLVLSVHDSDTTGRTTLAKAIRAGDTVSPTPALSFNDVELNLMREDAQVSPKKINREIFDWSTATEWNERTSNALDQALKPEYTIPSKLARDDWGENRKSDENSMNLELDPSQRGRASTQIGKAVHQVLQDINFDDTTNIQQLVAFAMEAYELEEDPANIEMKVRNILEAPILKGVSESQSIKEAEVAAKIDDLNGKVLRGKIDLLIRHPDDSFSIIDFKTDSVSGMDLEERAGQYAPQLGGYVLILESLGKTVARAVLIFSDGEKAGGSREIEIKDLVNAKTRAIAEAKIQLGI